MSDPGEAKIVCEQCGGEVKDDDACCPHCGALFTGLLVCDQHPEIPASGVCVICSRPACPQCGGLTKGRFLCDDHAGYEIREGMVRVLVDRAPLQAQRAASCLEEKGLHPLTIAGQEVYVPILEVQPAEAVLKELEFLSE
jgi:hypothetical protein